MEKDIYYDLCCDLKFANSENCRAMMQAVCPDETEAKILHAFKAPSTASEVANALSLSVPEVKEAILALRKKGAIGYCGFDREDEKVYRIGEYGLGTVEDFTDGISESIAALYFDHEKKKLTDPSKQKILDARLKFMHEDWYLYERPDELIHRRQIGIIGFGASLNPAVLALEKSGLTGDNLPEKYKKYSLLDAAKQTEDFYQAYCPCRFGEGVWSGYPLWTCTRIGSTISPGMRKMCEEELEIGIRRKVDFDTWHKTITDGERLGLIHSEGGCLCDNKYCNLIGPVARLTDVGKITPKTPFRSVSNPAGKDCLHCRRCIDKCYFKAIYMKDGLPAVDESKCYGCGSCVAGCPQDRFVLKITEE